MGEAEAECGKKNGNGRRTYSSGTLQRVTRRSSNASGGAQPGIPLKVDSICSRLRHDPVCYSASAYWAP